MRAAIAAALTAVTCVACVAPTRRADTRAERLEFERDRERCALRSIDRFGARQAGDFRACMRARGWAGPPVDE